VLFAAVDVGVRPAARPAVMTAMSSELCELTGFCASMFVAEAPSCLPSARSTALFLRCCARISLACASGSVGEMR
jgi:hypothetical protein